MLCAEQFKKKKNIPITLPNYYLLEDNEQWYPPLFSVFLSLIPKKILNKFHWVISPFLDSLICVLTVYAAFVLTSNITVAVIAGAVYLFSPAAFLQTKRMTSRQIGTLFLNLTVFFLFLSLSNKIFLLLYALSLFILVMAHKLNSQNFYITIPIIGILAGKNSILFYWMVGIFAVFILSKGFYFKVLKSNYDILRFWTKNWKKLGAHQLYHSPIYGNPKKYKNIFFYKYKILRYIIIIISDNPASFVLIAGALFTSIFFSGFNNILFYWIICTYGLVFLIVFVPFLRGIGEAHRYLPGLVPVTGILSGIFFIRGNFYVKAALLAAIFIGLLKIIKYLIKKRHQPDLVENDEFKKIISFINKVKEKEKVRIVCIPNHLCETLAYKCRVQVLWGGHTYPFKFIDLILPVWTKTLTELKKKYNLTHLVLDKKYYNVNEKMEKEISEILFDGKNYKIFKI
ncbi:MAG: hypothetical protein ACOC5R_00165 [Elusimicrobiota bacterium]